MIFSAAAISKKLRRGYAVGVIDDQARAILEHDTLVTVVVAHNKAGMRRAGGFGVLKYFGLGAFPVFICFINLRNGPL